MPKYLISATLNAEGLKGVQKDKASGRRRAWIAAIESLGGKLECGYFALGKEDAHLIVDLPDNVAAAALGLAVSSSGIGRTRTTALLTDAEVDRALERSVNYRPPGR